ncbi:unnamed protein product [Penicillium bialowiezense]
MISKAKGKCPVDPHDLRSELSSKNEAQTPSKKAARPTRLPKFSQEILTRKNWVKLEGNEAALAAYLGFTNTSELRKFMTSWPVLNAEKYFAKASKGARKKAAFTILANKHRLKEISAVTEYPDLRWSWTSKAIKKHQVRQKAMITAWSLHRMVLQVQEFHATTSETNTKWTMQARHEFLGRHREADYGRRIGDDFTFAQDASPSCPPELGPLKDLGETELESYNRCWELLRYLCAGQYKSNWENRFATPEALENGAVVTLARAPHWMQPLCRKIPPNLDKVTRSFPSDNEIPVEANVDWIHHARVRHYEETKEALEETRIPGEDIPPSHFQFPGNPCHLHTVQQFRDCLRRLFNCSGLGLDLQVVEIKYHCKLGEDVIEEQANGFTQNWKQMKETFQSSNHTDFTIEVSLQPFDLSDTMSTRCLRLASAENTIWHPHEGSYPSLILS